MKLKDQYLLIAVALIIAVAAFGTGTLTGAATRGRIMEAMCQVAQITSGVFEHRQDVDIPKITDLNSLEVIWEVREKIKQQFVYPVKDDKELTYGAIRGMLGSLKDPYSRFLDPEEFREFRTDNSGHFDGIGAVLESKADDKGRDTVVVQSILPEGPAAKSTLRPNDTIVKVDQTVVTMMRLDEVVKLIRGPRGTKVTLTVLRKGVDKPIEVSVVRANIQVKVVEFKMLDPEKKIGYIWLRSFNQNATAEMQSAIKQLTDQGMKSLVFDLSSDPGGILDVAVEVGSFFIDDGPIVWTRTPGQEPRPLNAIPGKCLPKNMKIVCLVDGGSASASEIVAGALQDTQRALVVGQHSFGKSKVQTICELQDQSAMFLTTAIYYTPKMRDIGEKDEKGNPGVKPDVAFPEPDVTVPDFDAKKWHEDQVDLAKAELLKLLAQ